MVLYEIDTYPKYIAGNDESDPNCENEFYCSWKGKGAYGSAIAELKRLCRIGKKAHMYKYDSTIEPDEDITSYENCIQEWEAKDGKIITWKNK